MKELLCLSVFGLLLASCSIRGSYYILNSSNLTIKIELRYGEFCDLQREFEQMRIREYQDEKIKFLTYKHMDALQITMDTNRIRMISLVLPKNYLLYIGSGTNTELANIEELRIIDSGKVTVVKEEEIEVSPSRGGYVGTYIYK